jgi:hypothetical protein
MIRFMSVSVNGAAMVPDYDALYGGVLRFIGRRHDASAGANGGWVPTGDVVQVSARAEYIQEVRAGALVARDAQTAKLAGVAFDVEERV